MSGARFSFQQYLSLILVLGGASSCATAPKPGEFTQREMMEAACPAAFGLGAGSHPTVVKGSIWTKIESKEMTGQFPATVLSEYPGRLAVEVTNLIGAPQAWLKMENGKTEFRFSEKNEKEYGNSSVRDMLGGLPLELAPRLFAGGVPCPTDAKNQDIRVHEGPDGGLEVEALDLRTRDSTRYVYLFTRYAGKPWVKEMRWEKLAKGGSRSAKSVLVTFQREEPSDPDGAPKKWSASSSSGEIRVRWKDRMVGLKP